MCRHIPDVDNSAADALSRDSLSSFQRLVPDAVADSTPIHEGLLQCLVCGKVDWVALFRNSI